MHIRKGAGFVFFFLIPSWVHFLRGQRDEKISASSHTAVCPQEGDFASLSLSFPYLGTRGTTELYISSVPLGLSSSSVIWGRQPL